MAADLDDDNRYEEVLLKGKAGLCSASTVTQNSTLAGAFWLPQSFTFLLFILEAGLVIQ